MQLRCLPWGSARLYLLGAIINDGFLGIAEFPVIGASARPDTVILFFAMQATRDLARFFALRISRVHDLLTVLQRKNLEQGLCRHIAPLRLPRPWPRHRAVFYAQILEKLTSSKSPNF